MQHVVKESEGEERGRKTITRRMSGRSRGGKERQKIKKPFPAERKENHSPPQSTDKNDVCYDSDRVK